MPQLPAVILASQRASDPEDLLRRRAVSAESVSRQKACAQGYEVQVLTCFLSLLAQLLRGDERWRLP